MYAGFGIWGLVTYVFWKIVNMDVKKIYVKTSGLCVGNKSANMLFIGSEISLPNILTKKNH
jgi:hypothetical protein